MGAVSYEDVEWAWKVLGHWVAQAYTPQCQVHGKTKLGSWYPVPELHGLHAALVV